MAFVVSLDGSVSNVVTSPRTYCQPLSFLVGLFIMDGVITIPIALFGFYIMPGMPAPAQSALPLTG